MKSGEKVRTFEVESETTPGKVYTVTLWLSDYVGFKAGHLSCSCPSWRFKRLPLSERFCKHTVKVQRLLEDLDETEAIKEIKGSEVTFNPEAVKNGRLLGLIETIMKQ